VPTVPLANQQAQVFEQELTTKLFTGDTNKGTGTKASFDKEIQDYEVRKVLVKPRLRDS